MPARVNNPRAADQLRQEYSVSGERINLQVDDVVVPVAIVSDLTAGSSGVPVVRRAYGSFNQAAVVAEHNVWRLEVPPGIIGILRRVYIRLSAAGVVRVHFGASFVVVPTNAAHSLQFMDGRLRESQGLTCAGRLVYDTQAGVLAAPFHYMEGAGAAGQTNVVEWPFGRVDGYYDFIEFYCDTVNVDLTCTLEWDEVQMFT